jgi:uncharacterized protein (DUF2126 family)
VRYVDSSVERLQVKVTGMVDDRYVLTCNGRPFRCSPPATCEFVAGVRYRAWQPAVLPAPDHRPHAPLVFDLVDTWMQRSLGGCQYHVAHPGGRSYETFPVNAFEAEAAAWRASSAMGHTPEMLEADGAVRPHWRRNSSHLDAAAPDEMHASVSSSWTASDPAERRHLQRLCRPPRYRSSVVA